MRFRRVIPRPSMIRKFIPKMHTKPGESPGVMVIRPDLKPPKMRFFAFSKEEYREREIKTLDDVPEEWEKLTAAWTDVQGLGGAEVLHEIGDYFNFHPLSLEDVLNMEHEPKVEDFEDYLFIIGKIPSLNDKWELHLKHVAIYLGDEFVVTFHEEHDEAFEVLKERIRTGGGRVRDMGADYLAYRILDIAVDAYFPILQKMADRLEDIEDEVLRRPHQNQMIKIQDVRHDLTMLRRSLWPLRDAINSLIRDNPKFFAEETRPFLRDLYDHIIRAIDLVETYREIGTGIRDIFMTNISNRLNEIMKVLTIISTIFIPLSFIAGVYGMNFDPAASKWNMPELSWKYGYPAVLSLMFLIGVGLLGMFWYFGWIRMPKRRNNKGGE